MTQESRTVYFINSTINQLFGFAVVERHVFVDETSSVTQGTECTESSRHGRPYTTSAINPPSVLGDPGRSEDDTPGTPVTRGVRVVNPKVHDLGGLEGRVWTSSSCL